MQNKINKLFESENWKAARKIIVSELKRDPRDHWLLTRLASTYYEEFDYKKALRCSLRAYNIDPKCPLVLWDLAGSYDMLGNRMKAIEIFRSIIKRGVNSIAFGHCGEGLALARGLVADSYYRMGRCYHHLGNIKKAQSCYRKHLSLRGPGCRSIYSLRYIKAKVA